MRYREYAPSARLAQIVHCFWTLEGRADVLGSADQPVLPDGRAELIVHFGDPFERVEARGVTRQPAILLAGQLTAHLILRPTGRVAVLGVRFHSAGAAAVAAVPQHELAGLTLGVDDVSAPLARELAEVRDSADTPAAAVAMVDDRLAAIVDRRRIDSRIHAVVAAIRRRRGIVSIESLASYAGLTRRHLERRFGDMVGVSPKRLARIARFQHALAWLDRAGDPRRGTIAAVECGYADQAHFIRDFRDLAGCPPGEHVLRRAELTGFFVERDVRM